MKPETITITKKKIMTMMNNSATIPRMNQAEVATQRRTSHADSLQKVHASTAQKGKTATTTTPMYASDSFNLEHDSHEVAIWQKPAANSTPECASTLCVLPNAWTNNAASATPKAQPATKLKRQAQGVQPQVRASRDQQAQESIRSDRHPTPLNLDPAPVPLDLPHHQPPIIF
jgi:hypothetical protein